MVLVCKICGGDITVDRASGTATCEYCGSKQTLPQFSDQSARLLYDSGHNYLLHNEYDKAENVFNQLLTIHPQDAEIHWALVLCKYGVTYVCDPATQKYIPTCNRTHYMSVLQDEHYLKAVALATAETKMLYEADAQTIDNIQKGIIAVSKKEKPFDIFISYKETDANGNRTKDSVEAQNLYEKLTAQGYKVFFSRITLENKIGSQYEPYIYAALSSSKVMLTVSSCKENIEAPWVKNEWSRFLTLRQADASKSLIPLYYDMQRADLPEEFAVLAAQDMRVEGFEQELIRGIKKTIPLPIMLAEKRKKNRKRLLIALLVVLGVLLVAGAIASPSIVSYMKKDKAYDEAMRLFNNAEYVDAMAAFEALGDFKDAEEQRQAAYQARQDELWGPSYEAAMKLYYDGSYAKALWAFQKLPEYKDTVKMRETCEKSWRESVATVVTDNDQGGASAGHYYITAAGKVEAFSFAPGSANDGIEFSEHGKVVSIGDGRTLMALYEDGYLWNSAEKFGQDTDLTDVIQVTPSFLYSYVALKNDGTVVCSTLTEEGQEEPWLDPVKEWKNIVSLHWDFYRYGAGGIMYAVLVGLDVDGNVHAVVFDSDSDNYLRERMLEYLSSLKNIKAIDVTYSQFEGGNIAALDTNGKLWVYTNGEQSTFENEDILAFEVSYRYANEGTPSYYSHKEVYIVDSKRVMKGLFSGDEVMQDVVWLQDGYIITRSGSIYHNYESKDVSPTDCGAKTSVRDVWLTRR